MPTAQPTHYSQQEWQLAEDRWKHDATSLTDQDIAAIDYWMGSGLATDARLARAKALAPTPPQAPANPGLTERQMEQIAKGVGGLISTRIMPLIVALDERCAKNDERLKALEAPRRKSIIRDSHGAICAVADEPMPAVPKDDIVKGLEARIAELERRPPGVEYKGVYDEVELYDEGNLVTRRGGLWLCLKRTSARPGSDPTSWRLIVKQGEA